MRGSRLTFLILFLAVWGTAQADVPKPPVLRAAAAIILEAKTGAALFEKNPDKRLPPASTTKIMTAWLFARAAKPDQRITTPPEAAKVSGSVLGMTPGETFTARDLLYAMLLPSANDACIAAAKQSAGSVPAFVARMNQEAQKLALPNTHFVNTNGLPAPNHYASARDLALLARQALGDPAFAAAVRTKTYRVPRANRAPTELINRNELLWTVPGMDGVKTGQTQAAGFCFVGSVTRKGRRLITVVLNSPDWKAETLALINYGFKVPVSSSPASPEGTGTSGFAQSQTLPSPRFGRGIGGDGTPPQGREKNHSPEGKGLSGLAGTQALPSSEQPGQATGRGGGSEVAPGKEPDPTFPITTGGGSSSLTSQSGGGSRVTIPSTNAGSGNEIGEKRQDGSDRNSVGWSDYQPRGSGIVGKQETVVGQGREDSRGVNKQTGQGNVGKTPPVWPRFSSPKPVSLPRFWWLWILLLLLLLAGWLLSHLSGKGNFAMKPGLLWPFARRRSKPTDAPAPSSESGPTRRRIPVKAEKATLPFAFLPPQLPRLPVRDWLSALLENTPRLLEAAVRRQARSVISANPALDLEKAFAMLSAPKAKTRLLGAEILMDAAPRRAEETLIALLEDEKTPADVRTDATNLLAEETGDRHEPFFLKMMLRDGSQAAARSLARLPRLETTTTAALRRIAIEGKTERDSDTDLRARLLAAQAACVLGAQGQMDHDEIRPVLEKLPTNHREQTLTGTLRGVTSPWAIERMVGVALRGQAAYPALQNLMECDPEAVRDVFDGLPELDSAARTRAMVLRRILLGEGEMEPIKKLAEAGDNLANSALQLERLQRWHPSQAAPEALLAAAMLTSLRLGFTSHTPEKIAAVFRTVGEEGQDALAESPELVALRQAYAHPDVYDAVQAALTTEDGLGLLTTSFLHASDTPPMQEEVAFWSDKLSAEARLPLTQTLASCDSESARAALAARAADPNPTIRTAALRAVHAHARTLEPPPTVSQPVEPTADNTPVEPISLDKAA